MFNLICCPSCKRRVVLTSRHTCPGCGQEVDPRTVEPLAKAGPHEVTSGECPVPESCPPPSPFRRILLVHSRTIAVAAGFLLFLVAGALAIRAGGPKEQGRRGTSSRGEIENGRRSGADGREITVEGNLRFIMVSDGFSVEGFAMSPPAYYVASETATYLLQFGKDTELIDADEYRRCPGFERLIQGGPPFESVGSGPVFEPSGSRVRLRGIVLGPGGMLGGEPAQEMRVTRLERLKTSEPAPSSRSRSSAEAYGRITRVDSRGETVASQECIGWLPIQRPGARPPNTRAEENAKASAESVSKPELPPPELSSPQAR